MTVDIRNPRGKLFCIGFAVIFPANERVLKCNPTACFCKVIAACIENFINRIFIGNRHQLAALFIVRRMKGKCQGDLESLICQFVHIRYDSAGGNGDVSLADVESFLARKQPHEAHQIVVVVHRLTRSHDNQIGDPLPGVLLNPVNLVEHLRRSQPPHESADCGRAEAAAHPAADLG